MNRTGLSRLLITLVILILAHFGAVAAATPPFPVDTVGLCDGNILYDTLVIPDQNLADTSLRVELVSGPGQMTSGVSDMLYGYYEFAPTVDTQFVIEYRVHSEANDSTLYYKQYVINVDQAPTIADQYNSFKVCYGPGERYLKVYATDPESAPIGFTLLDGPGTIDPSTGWITYTFDTAGVYSFLVSVYDDCSVDSAMIYDTVWFNSPPILLPDDTTVAFCGDPQEICFDVTALDPDGDMVWIDQVGGPGSTTALNDSTVRTCFLPDNVDSASYVFYYSYLDDCEGLGNRTATASPEWLTDSVIVTVIKNKPPTIYCPDAQEFFTCTPDTFCFDIDATDPELGTVTFNILSGNATLNGNTVCVAGDSSASFDVVIEAVDDCGNADTCTVPVTINGNRPPVVQSDPNFDMTLCTPETVCFRAAADDPDGDIASVTVNYGDYDSGTNRVCLLVDTAGVYTLIVTATDSCGATDSDTTLVAISVPTTPTVMLPDDFEAYQCGASEICVPVTVVADSINNYILPPTEWFTFDQAQSQICFTPDTAGVYTIVFGVVGACDQRVTDTVNVTVTFPPPPSVDLGDDFGVSFCEPQEICVDMNTAAAYESLTSNIGQYNDQTGQLCFTPDTAGAYMLTAEISDSCGFTAADTVMITVDLNVGPYVSSADDFDMGLCDTDTICFAVTATDPDNNMQSVIVSNGGMLNASNNTVCFVADTTGVYEFVLTATDSCGISASDTTRVTIYRAVDPSVNLGDDFSVVQCAPEEICIPVEFTADDIQSHILPQYGTFDSTTNQICFTPDRVGDYQIEFGLTDGCGRTITDTIIVSVDFSTPPIVTLGDDFDVKLCEIEPICVDVALSGNYTSVTPNLGSYDPQTGQVCFLPEGPGSYELIVSAADSCDQIAADTVVIGVSFGAPPVVGPMPDTTVYLCKANWICLPLAVSDPDNDLMSVTINNGMIWEDQMACFVAYTQGEYDVIVTATDSCGNVAVDTGHVTVLTDEDVSITWPTDTTVFTCSLVDTFCFAIPGIPDNATVTTTGINTWWDAEAQTVCFWSECSNTNTITVTASTECNTYSNTFKVRVNCNSDPLVILPPDSSLTICSPTTVCVPVGVSDVDHNLATVNVTGGTYNATTHRVCVEVDTAGTYVVMVQAIDECGAEDSDQMTIHVVGNTPPEITVGPFDSSATQCEPTEICIPVSYTDVDDNVVSVTTSLGAYDAGDGTVCFLPDTTGFYWGRVVVTDECGAADTGFFQVTVTTGDYVAIECPTDVPIMVNLCAADQVCLPLNITGSNFEVTTSFGTWVDGQLCFDADTSGVYNITVFGSAQCNSDTCTIPFNVTISDPVVATCPGDTTLFLCEADTICLPFTVSATATDVTLIGDAYIDGSNVCVPMVATAGAPTISLVATGECGADTCSFTVTYTRNHAPTIAIDNPEDITSCGPASVCLLVLTSDVDNNIVSIDPGEGVLSNDTICFNGLAAGTHRFGVSVIDACGAIGVDTVVIRVLPGVTATILCPSSPPIDTICGPDTVCVAAPVTPADAEVTVTPVGSYDPQTGNVCVPVSETGTIHVQMIATALCNADTCEFDVSIVRAEPPTVTVTSRIDTLLCLTAPQTITYPVTVTGTNVTVEVSGGATYSNGMISLTVSEAGTYPVTVTATGFCGSVDATTDIVVARDQAPVIYLPQDQTFERCSDDTDLICIDGIYATDIEGTPDIAQVCGVGDFTLAQADSGAVCFLPDTFGVYSFCYEATDGCNSTRDTFYVTVNEKPECDVCLKLWIDGGDCTPVGVNKQVNLYIDSRQEVAGFDVLLSFDKSVLSFNWVTVEGGAINDWEYFTYRVDDVSCGTGCSERFLRLIGIADVNNGVPHPPESAYLPNGLFATIEFYVANDQNLGDQFLPIDFYWFDCGDNLFSDRNGNSLIDLRILDLEGNIIWDEDDDVNFPEANRYAGLGAPDNCISPDTTKPRPTRCAIYQNGGIWVCHPDSLDDRGDINLNNVPYEIGDVVIFSNYFIYGLSVFTINIAGQTAATDVNADGITLSVADLVYLIRVVVGDAEPLPRLNPYDTPVTLTQVAEGNQLKVSTDAPGEIGAAYFIYRLEDGAQVNDVRAGADAQSMDLIWNADGNELRVLLYDMGTDFVAAGDRDLLQIDATGDLKLVKSELADYNGRAYNVAAGGSRPSSFVLEQNYPNPFNPSTTINFSLARVCDWSLQVYNVNGSLVREFIGHSDAGPMSVFWDGTSTGGQTVASGVYFYRLQAGDFSDTKKMILLK